MDIQPESTGDKPYTETKKTSGSGKQRVSKFKGKKSAKVYMLVAGETFCTDVAFMKRLKSKLKGQIFPKVRRKLKLKMVDTQKSCNIILVFCPVVSRIGTDMEAAMARVTEDKPVILVFMHHCHNPSYMTNTTVQPSRDDMQIVHCAFHESKGLLQCEQNKLAVKAVRSALWSYVDSHDEVRHAQSKQQMAAKGYNRAKITNDNETPGMDTDPVREKKQSAKGHFTARSGVKVHILIAGETFNTHETFIQKLKLKIEDCNEKSCNIILLFCPVVSRIGTDMEAAMAGVTEDKPVILVFMHHCHKSSHMTNTTVQPSRDDMQVVHCAFHQTEGLLKCKANRQAVKEVRLKLKKYKNKRMGKKRDLTRSKHD